MALAPLTVEPNPAIEGQDIHVSYGGEHDLYYSVDGEPWQKLPLDQDGNATLQAPIGASSVVISDRQLPTVNNIDVEIISTGL